MIYALGLSNTKQREFFFVSSFDLFLAYASTMFLWLCLCRSICRRLDCIRLFCLLFVLMFMLMFKPAAHERKQFANGLVRQFAQLFPLVCGGVFVRVSPCNAERKIAVMFNIQNSPYHGCRKVLTIHSDMEFYSNHGLENRFE